jgi:hypothetical protein
MEKTRILDLLVIYEEKTSELFRIYSDKIRRYSAFWCVMAREQEARASIVHRLKHLVEKNILSYRSAELNELLIRDAITRICEEKDRAMGGKAGAKQAFAFTLELEMGMIAVKFLEVFKDPKGTLKETFRMLKDDALKHSETIRDECLKFKSSEFKVSSPES